MSFKVAKRVVVDGAARVFLSSYTPTLAVMNEFGEILGSFFRLPQQEAARGDGSPSSNQAALHTPSMQPTGEQRASTRTSLETISQTVGRRRNVVNAAGTPRMNLNATEIRVLASLIRVSPKTYFLFCFCFS